MDKKPKRDGLRSGPSRNYQVFDPLDFLAEFTQHRPPKHYPPKGAHLVRYYGWYSNRARGMRRKAAEAEGKRTVPASKNETPEPAAVGAAKRGRC